MTPSTWNFDKEKSIEMENIGGSQELHVCEQYVATKGPTGILVIVDSPVS